MKNKIIKNNSDALKLAVIGASLAALAGTAYFLLGPNGKKNQKHTKAWALKMKSDVVEKLEKVRDITEPIYNEIIDSIAIKYEKLGKVDVTEIKELVKDLKKHWKTISLEAQASNTDVKKSVAKVAKKVKKSLD